MSTFPNYHEPYKNIEKKAGGVLSYIGDSIQYQNRPDLQMAQISLRIFS